MPDYTPYQQAVIRRYYDNRQALALQRLGDLVGQIYLAGTARKRDQLWKRAAVELEVVGRWKDWCRAVLESRDPARLAALVNALVQPAAPGRPAQPSSRATSTREPDS